MALPVRLSYALGAADDDGISLSQSPGAAGNLTITGAFASGGVATLDVPRRVLITSAGDDHLITFTVYGTNAGGAAISEVVTGPNATTAYTNQDFKTVTRIAVSAATAGAVKAGTNGIGSTPWILLNRNAQPFQVGVWVEVIGTVNYTIQTTPDDIMGYYSPGVGVIWNNPAVQITFDDTVLIGATANGNVQIEVPCQAVRLLINSGTGTATLIVIQAGIRG